jgi:hypothetical protein
MRHLSFSTKVVLVTKHAPMAPDSTLALHRASIGNDCPSVHRRAQSYREVENEVCLIYVVGSVVHNLTFSTQRLHLDTLQQQGRRHAASGVRLQSQYQGQDQEIVQVRHEF